MAKNWFQSGDFSPEDGAKAGKLDVSGLEVRSVEGADDPLLADAYAVLWREFGAKHELEELGVIRGRLDWRPAFRASGTWLRYEMIVVRFQGEIIGVRDHTAIVSEEWHGGAWVHLSHVWVMPGWRRTGLSAWLRVWPIECARECLRAAGRDALEPVTLLAEMEHPNPGDATSLVRLQAYERGGFKKVDPDRVRYWQPDFRSAEEIEASGGARPLPFLLLVRRVGDVLGGATKMDGGELRAMVSGLYRMYGQGFRDVDMRPVWNTLQTYPVAGEAVSLGLPTEGYG